MQLIDDSIIKTLCYANIFDFPLREEEVWRNLIADKKTPPSTIKKRLTHLSQTGIIGQTDTYYHLSGRSDIVKKRQARHQNSLQKNAAANDIAQKLAKVPYIKAIFLTGAVAVDNATRQDDIDILIVSAKDSLWTCRFLAILWLELKRLRRRPRSKYNAGKICLNLMLTVDTLSVPPSMRSVYTAHEVTQVKPLYDPENYVSVFQNDNSWITEYLPNTDIPEPALTKLDKNTQAPRLIEIVLRQLQRLYMWPKRTRETITPKAAYFHPRDTGRTVLAKLSKSLKQYEQQ